MDDILSQIIAYAPDKIDTELKARALVQVPRTHRLKNHGTCTNYVHPGIMQYGAYIQNEIHLKS